MTTASNERAMKFLRGVRGGYTGAPPGERLLRVLVVGASGFVGSHVVRALLDAGHEVTGFKRSTTSLELLRGIELPWHEGDVLDADSLRVAVAGHDAVIACSGALSLWGHARERLYATNVLGARNIARACLEAKVKLVIDGSAGVYAGSPRIEVADERGVASAERYSFFHVTTMALAEAEILRAVVLGLDATILHPTLVVGAGDRSFHSSWLLLGLARSRFGIAPPGGMNMVSVEDVARAHLLALEKAPRKGSVYLLGSENLTNRAAIDLLQELMGSNKRVLTVPAGPFRALGAVAHAIAVATGRSQLDRLDLNSELARAATLYWFVDSSKAEKELGWKPGPVRPALDAQIAWLEKRGLLNAPRRSTSPLAASSNPLGRARPPRRTRSRP
jgi:dihydroflavonol-4-reductase